MNEARLDKRAPVQRILAWPIALTAAAGGLIHLKASVDHRDLAVVAIGFAIMGTGQWLFAGTMIVRPSRTALVWGGGLHGVILLVWILSRTIGLLFIPGAETAAPVGVADVVANTFSIAIAGTVAVALAVYRSDYSVVVPRRAFGTMRAVVLAVVLILTVAALAEPHDHSPYGIDLSQPATSHHKSDLSTPTTHVHSDHQHAAP